MRTSKSNSEKLEANIYHEKQKLQFCLIHTLNNILQKKQFTPELMNEICYSLDKSRWFNPHRSSIGLGNYDVNVLMAALQRESLKMIWFDKRLEVSSINFKKVFAFILNVPTTSIFPFMKGRHWFPLLRINDKCYNLDSKLKLPQEVLNLKGFLEERKHESDTEIMIVIKNGIKEESVVDKLNMNV